MKYYFPIHLNGDNRGCEAIAKGTAIILKEQKENLIGLCTDVKLDRKLGIDKFVTLQPSPQVGIITKIIHKLQCGLVHDEWKRKVLRFKVEYDSFLSQLDADDVMISTGGDMMCYTENQVIYTVDYLHKRGIRSILWGCSVGRNNLTPRKIKALKQFSWIYARETLTQEVLAEIGINNVSVYPDPAFVLLPELCKLPDSFSRGEVVGINLSNYVMGGFNLNTPFAKEVDQLIMYILQNTDFQILLIPHVMWRGQDDRIISNLIQQKYNSNRIQILDSDSLNYCQIRYVISKCACFIGARTHSVISAYSTCTPAIALGYSIKSKGIAKDIGMPEIMVVDSKNLVKGKIIEAFNYVRSKEWVSDKIYASMDKYRCEAMNAIEIINCIK